MTEKNNIEQKVYLKLVSDYFAPRSPCQNERRRAHCSSQNARLHLFDILVPCPLQFNHNCCYTTVLCCQAKLLDSVVGPCSKQLLLQGFFYLNNWCYETKPDQVLQEPLHSGIDGGLNEDNSSYLFQQQKSLYSDKSQI